MKGWERSFWNLLSPEATARLKEHLATYTPPCPSLEIPLGEDSAAAAPLLPVAAAALTPGTRIRMQYGWPLLEQYLDGIVTGYRPDGTALIRFDGDDYDTLVSPSRLTPAPPRPDGFGDDE